MKTTPTLLCSDVLHVVLLRSHQVPIELRKIIIDDYLPFLIQDYARDLLKVADLLEFKRLASEEQSHSNKVFFRNVIANLAASNPNDSYFQLEFRSCPFPFLYTIYMQIYHYQLEINKVDLLIYQNNMPIPEYIKPKHHAIAFRQEWSRNFSFRLSALEITEENVEEVHKTIMVWYEKVICAAWKTKELFHIN